MAQLSTSSSSNYEDWGSGLAEGPRIRTNFPIWIVKEDPEFPGDIWIICPKVSGRCGEATLVNKEKWLAGTFINGSGLTRPCPYCFKASRVPNDL